MNRVNLIPTRHRLQRRLRARRKTWTRAVCAYAVMLLIGYGGWHVLWANDGQDLSRQLSLAHGDLEDLNKSVVKTRAALNETQLVLRANQAVNGQPDWSLLLALLGKLRGEEVVLNRCGLESIQPSPQAAIGGGNDVIVTPLLKLHGFGKTQTAVSQFALRLEQTGLFEAVALLKTNRESFLTGEAIAFRIECRLKVGATPAVPVKTPAIVGPQPRAGTVAGLSDTGDNTP